MSRAQWINMGIQNSKKVLSQSFLSILENRRLSVWGFSFRFLHIQWKYIEWIHGDSEFQRGLMIDTIFPWHFWRRHVGKLTVFLLQQQSEFLLKIMLVTIWGRVGGDILLMITSLMLPIMNDRLNDNNVVAVAEDYDILVLIWICKNRI